VSSCDDFAEACCELVDGECPEERFLATCTTECEGEYTLSLH
jgi:hypothetical protein